VDQPGHGGLGQGERALRRPLHRVHGNGRGERIVTMQFWRAVAQASRAGRRHRTLDKCGHRHRSDASASACAEAMDKARPNARRRWTTQEIVFYRVGSRLPDGRIVR
jgi:hypothetical protein